MRKPIFEEFRTYGGEIVGKTIVSYEQVCRPGFSKMKHKKRAKKVITQPLTLEDFKLMGKGAGDAAKAFLEGYKEAISDK